MIVVVVLIVVIMVVALIKIVVVVVKNIIFFFSKMSKIFKIGKKLKRTLVGFFFGSPFNYLLTSLPAYLTIFLLTNMPSTNLSCCTCVCCG